MGHQTNEMVGEFDGPKGITKYSYSPSMVIKVAFHWSLGRILIWWYPLFKYIFDNSFDQEILFSKSSRRCIGKWYLTISFLWHEYR